MANSLKQIFTLGTRVAFLSVFLGCDNNQNQNKFPNQDTGKKSTILFIGDSLTAGYRLDVEQAYPALIQKKLEEKGQLYKVVNAGISGDTTSDGLNRLEWHMDPPPAVLVIALGANDALRGLDPFLIKENLKKMIQKAKSLDSPPQILLVGMKSPLNMGIPYAKSFNNIFPSLAEELEVSLVPFLLKDVATQANLNLDDGIHPNAQGHQIMAETVWNKLKKLVM